MTEFINILSFFFFTYYFPQRLLCSFASNGILAAKLIKKLVICGFVYLHNTINEFDLNLYLNRSFIKVFDEFNSSSSSFIILKLKSRNFNFKISFFRFFYVPGKWLRVAMALELTPCKNFSTFISCGLFFLPLLKIFYSKK